MSIDDDKNLIPFPIDDKNLIPFPTEIGEVQKAWAREKYATLVWRFVSFTLCMNCSAVENIRNICINKEDKALLSKLYSRPALDKTSELK